MRHFWAIAAAVMVSACVPSSRGAGPLAYLPSLAGDYFAIDSRESGHRYHIYIRYPEGYSEEPAHRYPAVYLLDGDSLYPHLAPLQMFLHYDDRLPEVVVVGIAYGSFDPPQNNRRHDFTDGADAFGRFLASELIPEVERRARTRPDRRILFGQSRGGGFVLHSAFSSPDLFWGRIASNPTLDSLPALARRPAWASRKDLRLMVTSGSGDVAKYRQPLADWIAKWRGQPGLPWLLRTESIAGGTHAADAGRVYRMAMHWLLGDDRGETTER